MLRKIEEPLLLDVLDRILDKGIVVDAWIRLSLAGIDFLTVEARVVVASIETYLQYAQALNQVQPQSAPRRLVELVPRKTTVGEKNRIGETQWQNSYIRLQ